MSSLPHQVFLCFTSSPATGRRRRPSVTSLGFSGKGEIGVGRGAGIRKIRENADSVVHEEHSFSPRPSASELISSPSNPFVKHCVKLRQSSSYRRSCGLALLVGLTPIREVASRKTYHGGGGGSEDSPFIDLLLLLDAPDAPSSTSTAFLDELGMNCSRRGGTSERVRIVRVSSMVMKKLAGLQSTDSTEAVAVMKIPRTFRDLAGRPTEPATCRSWFSSPPRRILVLDGIQDPGNIGTLLRSAMAFNWDGVFLLPGCCDPFNEKALRAARGACFHLPIISGDWVHLEAVKSEFRMKMLAARPEDVNGNGGGKASLSLSRNLADSLAASPLCLVLGSEGRGLSQEAVDGSQLVNIPMAGDFESLNVSVAGGIFMFSLQT